MMHHLLQTRSRASAFTLVEVIIAVGILASSVLAIIAFLGSVGQATTQVIDSAVAARIADNVKAELAKEDVDDLFGWTSNPNDPIQLMATRDGGRVRVASPLAARTIDNDPETGVPPGIALPDRYFLIEVRRLEGSLPVPANASQFQAESAMLPISVQVTWPYQVKTGPNTSVAAQPEQQSRYIFNTIILRKE